MRPRGESLLAVVLLGLRHVQADMGTDVARPHQLACRVPLLSRLPFVLTELGKRPNKENNDCAEKKNELPLSFHQCAMVDHGRGHLV